MTGVQTCALPILVRGLSEKRQRLAVEISDLNSQLRSQTQSDQNDKQLLATLRAQLDKLALVTGTTAAKGPGLEITIDYTAPILYIDLINMVNELWAAGAEAIAINDIRVTANTVIFYAEDENSLYITADNHKLNFPIIIKALGNPNTLEKGLTLPGGIMDNLALFKAFPVLKQVDNLSIPPVEYLPNYYFLKEYKPPETTPPVTAPKN